MGHLPNTIIIFNRYKNVIVVLQDISYETVFALSYISMDIIFDMQYLNGLFGIFWGVILKR